jgi:predicted nucleic acid-binding protein
MYRPARTPPSGRPASGGDAIIAGVAWSLDATIVTRNPRDFEGQGIPVLAYGQTAA